MYPVVSDDAPISTSSNSVCVGTSRVWLELQAVISNDEDNSNLSNFQFMLRGCSLFLIAMPLSTGNQRTYSFSCLNKIEPVEPKQTVDQPSLDDDW